MRLIFRKSMMRYLAVLIVSMLIFGSAQAKQDLKETLKKCEFKYKKDKSCVLNYANEEVTPKKLKKIIKKLERNKKFQWTLRFSHSGISTESGEIIAEFIKKGANVHMLDIIENNMSDEAIMKIIDAAHGNKNVKVVSLQNSTESNLDKTYLTRNKSSLPRLDSDLKVNLGTLLHS